MTSYYSKLLVSIPIFFVKNGTQFLDLGFKKKLKARFASSYLTYFQVRPSPIMGSIGSHLVPIPKSKTSKFSM